jgi:2-methylcitrate dehydratase PrpD
MDASDDIANFAASLRWAAINAEARRSAALFFHDSLCVGIAGANAPLADSVLDAAQGWSGNGGACHILGREHRLSPAEAAFVNAFQIHAQEYDCVHEPAVVHPLATVLAALLSELGRGEERSGERLLTALTVGVQVAVALGLAATTPLRFFRPATAGIFGSVAAIGSLRGLDPATIRNALGIALAFTSGTMQAHVEGKPTLPLQIAQAARSAVQAIDLAAAGFPGPSNAIEGPFGYLSLFEEGHDPARLRAGLRDGYRIGEVSWKPFPSGRASHGGIVAVQGLRAQGLVASDLEILTYRAPSLIERLVGRPAIPEMTPAYARLCFAWLAAVTLTRGTVNLNDFTPENLTDPALLAIAAKVRVEVDENPDPAAFVPATAVAICSDGHALREVVDAQFGSPAWPLSHIQHLAKARACLAFAGMEDRHDALAELIEVLPKTADVGRALNAVLRPRTH